MWTSHLPHVDSTQSGPDQMLCQLYECRLFLVMLTKCQLLISIGQNKRSGLGFSIYEVVLVVSETFHYQMHVSRLLVDNAVNVIIVT